MNWLKAYIEATKNTESPEAYWLWSGIFTIGAALRRNVWFPYGVKKLYPNLYVLIVAPPGETRKNFPVAFCKTILEGIGIKSFADSATRRALTKHMAKLTEKFGQANLLLISKELSSLLSEDLRGVIGLLVDGFDCADSWGHKTSTQGSDEIRNSSINFYGATTPVWIAKNIPIEVIGEGWTSRLIVLSGFTRGIAVPIPKEIPKDKEQALIKELGKIALLSGSFSMTKEAEEYFSEWYTSLLERDKRGMSNIKRAFLARAQDHALKVSMILHMAESRELIINVDDIGRAIDLIEDIAETGHEAFSYQGKDVLASEKQNVIEQINFCASEGKFVTFKNLMLWNIHNLNKRGLEEILEDLRASGLIDVVYSDEGMIIKPLKRGR